jgi:hypothetical protein
MKKIPQAELKTRKKDWMEKVNEVENSFSRAMQSKIYVNQFYMNLFFLNPKLKEYFKSTDWDKLHIAIIKSIEHMIGFFKEEDNEIHRQNLVRLGTTHSKKNLNIHPHAYYYWIDAHIMTLKELDPNWDDDLQYYVRECLFFPVSFMISLYHK